MKTSPTFWLTNVLAVQDCVALIAGIIFMTIPKEGRREYIYLGAYIASILAYEVTAAIGYNVFHMIMNPVLNVANIIYFTFVFLIYKKHIQVKNTDIIARIVIGLFLIFLQWIMAYNSYTWSTGAIIIVATSLYYFYLLIKKLPFDRSLSNLPIFWINTGILIYYLTTFVIFIFVDYLTTVLHNNLIVTFYFHYSLGIIVYSILARALWMIRTEYRKGDVTPNAL